MRSCLFLVLLLLCAVATLDHSHEHDSHDHEDGAPAHFKYSREANVKHDKNLPRRNESAAQIWAEVSLAILLISLAPLLVLCLLPNLQKHRSFLKLLLAFAAGGLLGDAFLHLIPHAIEATQASSVGHRHHDAGDHEHRHQHGTYHNVGIAILSGIFTFLCVEKLIRLARNQPHHHSAAVPATVKTSESTAASPGSSGDTAKKESSSKKSKKQAKLAVGDPDNAGKKAKDVKATGAGKQAQELKVASYLNLTADFMHNFTDGLAIGASFLMSRSLGIVTTFTVLTHELPHEVGDYAILVQSGCSSRKAILLQLITAVGAALGAALSLLAAGVGLEFLSLVDSPIKSELLSNVLSKLSSWLTEGLATGYLLAFTAGGFIYIAMTSVLPDLLEEEDVDEGVAGQESGKRRPCRPGFCRRLLQTVGELVAITAGVGMMISLGLMEEAHGHV